MSLSAYTYPELYPKSLGGSANDIDSFKSGIFYMKIQQPGKSTPINSNQNLDKKEFYQAIQKYGENAKNSSTSQGSVGAYLQETTNLSLPESIALQKQLVEKWAAGEVSGSSVSEAVITEHNQAKTTSITPSFSFTPNVYTLSAPFSTNTLTISNGSSITTGSKLLIDDGGTIVERTVGTITGGGVAADGSTNNSNTNAVPVMTSNTAPSGIAFITDLYTGQAFQLFDNNNITSAYSNTNTAPVFGYIFTTNKIINKVQILAYTGSGENSKNFTIEGSTDTITGSDGTWTILSTVANQTSWIVSPQETRTFTFNNSTPYKAYRIKVTLNNNSGFTDGHYTAFCGLSFIAAQAGYNIPLTQPLSNTPTASTFVAQSGQTFQIGSSATSNAENYTTLSNSQDNLLKI